MAHNEKQQLAEFQAARRELDSVLKPLQEAEAALQRFRLLWGRQATRRPSEQEGELLCEAAEHAVQLVAALQLATSGKFCRS